MTSMVVLRKCSTCSESLLKGMIIETKTWTPKSGTKTRVAWKISIRRLIFSTQYLWRVFECLGQLFQFPLLDWELIDCSATSCTECASTILSSRETSETYQKNKISCSDNIDRELNPGQSEKSSGILLSQATYRLVAIILNSPSDCWNYRASPSDQSIARHKIKANVYTLYF